MKVKKCLQYFVTDNSKAFDRVWHLSLLYKLQTAGIIGHLLQWFTDYIVSNDLCQEMMQIDM